MRNIRTFVAFVAVVLAGALPSMAAEQTAPAATETSPASAALAQPAELPWLLPEPTPAAAQMPGPCTVSVPCRFGAPVSCSGQSECEWQHDSKWIRGYVYCETNGNGAWYYCPTAASMD